MKYKTFQQKLDRFKREPVGFLVKSKEIADELAKVFEREEMESRTRKTAEEFMEEAWGDCGLDCNLYVAYNFPKRENGLSYGMSDSSGEKLDELLDITLEELKSYNAPHTLEDKLALFKAGTHVLHTPTQEIYDKLMVELEKRGYVWCDGKELPTKYNGYSSRPYVAKFFIYENNGIARQPKAYDKEVLTLTPAEFKPTQTVITITSDGIHRVTAETNRHSAEALCCPTDAFSLTKGSHMALQRLLEKVKEGTIEEPEFCVGDIVEVVWCYYSFADRVKGIQGVVVETGDNWCRVKLPVKFHGDVEWKFTDKQLKLVRKYNA